MSYPYSAGGHPNYRYTGAGYSPAGTVPQYTQSQINTYYQQYQCYPPQPFAIIQDTTYVQPAQHPAVSTSEYVTAQSYYTQHVDSGSASDIHRSNKRTRTWTCDEPDCTSTANFTRLADLQRHQATVHGNRRPDFPCTVPRCSRVGDKGFTRRDHLVEHLRNFHHLDIPKRRPGERSANPLGLPGYFQGS